MHMMYFTSIWFRLDLIFAHAQKDKRDRPSSQIRKHVFRIDKDEFTVFAR